MAESVTEIREDPNLPDHLVIHGAPRFSANQLRQIRAVSGKTMEQLLEDGADVIQANAYITLRKMGHAPTWDQAGDIPVEFQEEPADPS
jgi:hypothetical protein